MLGRVFVLCTGESFNNSLEGECETYLLTNFNIIERVTGYLTIIPWTWMGSESIADEALKGHEGKRNNYCFSKIQLGGQKYWDKTTLASKNAIQPPLFRFSKPGVFTTSGL